MKKVFIFTIFITGLVGCSSSPFKEETAQQNKINQHLSQGVKYLEGDFEEKYNSSGRSGMYMTAIGTAIYPVEKSQKVVESAAVTDAKFRLTESAPSNFKREVQQAIGTEYEGVGDYSEISVSVTEVRGLTGIKVRYSDISCKTKVSPTSKGSYKTERECRAIAKVKLSDLKKAYSYTLDEKYRGKKKQIDRRVAQQLTSK